jgi:hypothetical protein
MANPILEELDDFIEEMNIIGQDVLGADYDGSSDSDYLKRVVASLEVLGRSLRTHLEGDFKST